MEHRCKVTVLDKKLYPELQSQFCAVPDSGKCPCYNVGDEFLFFRNDERDDYWHMGAGTLIKSGNTEEGCLKSPGTMHCGEEGVPFCSEAWDAISRYIYTALQGGSIMHGWMKDDKVMIACCNDGTRPVIFKIERIDVEKTEKKLYKLLDANGKTYLSETPGEFGGNSKEKVYGRLDCGTALANMRRFPGAYQKSRVFFADEKTALAAGYHPCGNCLRKKYREYMADPQKYKEKFGL